MKSPTELAERLARQWHRAPLRVERLLSADSWPLRLPIGKPTGGQFAHQIPQVQAHVQRWRAVSIGEVIWETVNYRAGAEPVSVPVYWCLRTPSEWVAATGNDLVREEFSILEELAHGVSPLYRELLVTERPLWRSKAPRDVITAATLADTLSPGIAAGRPLRLLGGLEVDTKFVERHATLLTRLLDERYNGAASEQGLYPFLDAPADKDHWLMIVPLQAGLLPFRRQRVTAQELARAPLPGSRVLVVENEQCLHLLPALPDTVAILGAGLDLQWLGADTFRDKQVAYWGDMDTWGLLMLARARQYCPALCSLMMTRAHFERHAPGCAVPEPVPAKHSAPAELNDEERAFFEFLLGQEKGRLEQEYLPEEVVHREMGGWGRCHGIEHQAL
ncbi:hypothetical protein S7S_05645 [Isoalcanivorax pacificus W11-5]|uniref:Wadjet protein JetD C-terminal domain-containing protein n=1 Tax=Isoalcanivorax pacificus W11-5 TaxID=391936 RepID=A0A0B4XMJ0_9GAMM|nr:DUF3322 domain-containing protein [Isoalcanivorax pacificus]AJD47547.1 hypothetical protein S7S_05645 [Isoalcanivorax pacificus W11-5]